MRPGRNSAASGFYSQRLILAVSGAGPACGRARPPAERSRAGLVDDGYVAGESEVDVARLKAASTGWLRFDPVAGCADVRDSHRKPAEAAVDVDERHVADHVEARTLPLKKLPQMTWPVGFSPLGPLWALTSNTPLQKLELPLPLTESGVASLAGGPGSFCPGSFVPMVVTYATQSPWLAKIPKVRQFSLLHCSARVGPGRQCEVNEAVPITGSPGPGRRPGRGPGRLSRSGGRAGRARMATDTPVMSNPAGNEMWKTCPLHDRNDRDIEGRLGTGVMLPVKL